MRLVSSMDALAAELGVAALDANAVLPNSGNIRRYALTADGQGGNTETWIADSGSIGLRLGQRQPSQPGNLGQRLLDRTDDFHLTIPNSASASLRDRILVGATSYELQSIEDTGDWSIYNQCLAVLVDQPYTVVTNGTPTLQPVHSDADIVSYDFFHAGNAAVGVGSSHRRVNGNWRCLYVAVTANVAPGTGPTVFDILLNGVTIFTVTGHRPTLAAGITKMVTQVPDVWQFSDGDDLQASTVSTADLVNPSSDITLQVVVTPR